MKDLCAFDLSKIEHIAVLHHLGFGNHVLIHFTGKRGLIYSFDIPVYLV